MASCPAGAGGAPGQDGVTGATFLQRGSGLRAPPRELTQRSLEAREAESLWPPPPGRWGAGRQLQECASCLILSPASSFPTCQSCHMAAPPPTRRARPSGGLPAHAGLTHARPAARHAGPCAAVARCPLAGTARQPQPGRWRWGGGWEGSGSPLGAGGEGGMEGARRAGKRCGNGPWLWSERSWAGFPRGLAQPSPGQHPQAPG